jgi:hypothetical protein
VCCRDAGAADSWTTLAAARTLGAIHRLEAEEPGRGEGELVWGLGLPGAQVRHTRLLTSIACGLLSSGK